MTLANPQAIDPDTAVSSVGLTVSHLSRSRDFYERVVGLTARELEDGRLGLSADASRALIDLRGDASAAPLRRRATGLFHLAILVPSRRDLAVALARLEQAAWPLDGASDHLVSEALYLSDPDGNGIEIYRDRPRSQWRRRDGQLEMATLPLDLGSLMRELDDVQELEPRLPPETRIGHVHLQVADLEQAEAFYSGLLGFDVVVRGYPGALFVSAGGYHHHVGLNTWNSAGAAPAPAGSIGLRWFEVTLPDGDALRPILARLRAAGVETEAHDAGVLVRDPSGNPVLLTAG